MSLGGLGPSRFEDGEKGSTKRETEREREREREREGEKETTLAAGMNLLMTARTEIKSRYLYRRLGPLVM